MHLVLCYDIVKTRRRSRLQKKLKGFLVPVQKSVFEGHLPVKRYPDLRDLVRDTIQPAEDTVRIYHLCGGCVGLLELFGTSKSIATEPSDVVL